MSRTPPSNRQVDSAGGAWRAAWAARPTAGWRELARSLGLDRVTIEEFRAEHQAPLTRVAANLRYYVDKHGALGSIVIGQRLKEFPSIVLKIRREGTMRLSQMQDVGGCRAVVTSQATAYDVVEDLIGQKRWTVANVDDYVAHPQRSGYRAIHLVIRKDGRFVEIQLRTENQHFWAEMIEGADRSGIHGDDVDLKHAEGSAEVLGYYRSIAELIASAERGVEISEGTLLDLRRTQARIFNLPEEDEST